MGDVRKPFDPGAVERILDRLTVMIMSNEMLLNGFYGPLSPEQKKVLSDLLAQAKDLTVLIRELTST